MSHFAVALECFLKIDSPQIVCKLWLITKTINIFKIFPKEGEDCGVEVIVAAGRRFDDSY